MSSGNTVVNEFLWGVATSAYQSEGGYNGPGEPQTNWAVAEQTGDVAPVGKAVEFWTRYPEDFQRARDLGLNAFRLGIEWSRVQPSTTASGTATAPPPFDFTALDHYAAMLAQCRHCELEPIVTLHHFVHPAWLGPDPWLTTAARQHFVRYVETAVDHLNSRLIGHYGVDPIRFFVTINEPNMLILNTYLGTQFPSGSRPAISNVIAASNQLLQAHIFAYNALHNLYERRNWGAPAVTLNNYCSDLYWSDKLWLDLLSLRRKGVPRQAVREHICSQAERFGQAFVKARLPLRKDIPFYFGNLIKRLSAWMGRRLFDPSELDPLLDAVYTSDRDQSFDYLGLDYYDPFAAHIFRLPVWWDHEFKNKSLRAWVMNSVTSKWWDWRVLPLGLGFFCEHYHAEYGVPVLIAENGMALRRGRRAKAVRRRDRMTRSEFLRVHVREVDRIRKRIPLIGYLHWSLFDNYEWGTYTPRFGLYSISYDEGTDRISPDEYGDEPARTYAQLIAECRAADNNALTGDRLAASQT